MRTGDFVRSKDERDDPEAIYVVTETGIEHVSGETARITKTTDVNTESLYRLEQNLHALDCDMDEDCVCHD